MLGNLFVICLQFSFSLTNFQVFFLFYTSILITFLSLLLSLSLQVCKHWADFGFDGWVLILFGICAASAPAKLKVKRISLSLSFCMCHAHIAFNCVRLEGKKGWQCVKVKCLHLTLSSYENSLTFYSGCSWTASCTFSALLLCNLFDVLPHKLRIRHVVGSVVVCERTQWQTKAEKTLKVTTTGRQEGQQKRRKKWEKEAEERSCAVPRPRPCCLVARHNEDNKSKQIKLEAAVLHVEISFLHSRFALFAPFRQNNLLKLFASIRLAVLCLSLPLSLYTHYS